MRTLSERFNIMVKKTAPKKKRAQKSSKTTKTRTSATNIPNSEAVTVIGYYSAEMDEHFVTIVPGLIPEDRKSLVAEQIFEAKYGAQKSKSKKSNLGDGDYVAFSSFSLRTDIGILKNFRSDGWFLQEGGKGLVFYAP